MKGTVEVVTSKMVDTKYGSKPAYRAKVGDTWIDVGFKKPPFQKGDVIEYEVEGQYNKLVSAKVVSSGASAAAPAGNRDRIIVRQNALGHATQIVLALLPDERPSTEVVAERVTQIASRLEHWVMDDKPE